MRTLFVIAPNTGLAAAIRAAVDPSRYRVIEDDGFHEDVLRLTGASFDICIFDTDLTTIEPIREIEKLRLLLPRCPVILFASDAHWKWEEEAYLLGVSHILSKPVRGRLLNSLLDRLLAARPADEEKAPPAPRPRSADKPASDDPPVPARMLQLLRNSASILGHSLSTEFLLQEFLRLLREILGLNRAAIFLRPSPVTSSAAQPGGASQRLASACALGLSPAVLEHFELSLEAGVGGYIFRSGRVLRRESPEVESDPRMAREFDVLGVRVAIPVLDRESLIGVAMLDERITGEPMTSDELALIFHLLEQLGLAIKNAWRHEQVSARQEMMLDIVNHIKAGCVVIGPELAVLHANEMAKSFFPRPNRPAGAFDFNDLPRVIGGKVFTVLKTGQPVAQYKHHSAAALGQTFQISITPFRKGNASAPTAALLVVEDCTAADRLRQLEIETANLRLVKQMAGRLAHEIGNTIVPISTHQQLLHERASDPDFQASLARAMEAGVKRVGRLVDQMRFLARDHVNKIEPVPVRRLIEDAFRDARAYHPSASVLLQYESSEEPLAITCDRQGLQHAFAEIILNALQASQSPCQVQVRTRTDTDSNGLRWVQIEVQDSGTGFSAEAADKAAEPFFTTRKVGLGLGLTITNKIMQTHGGRVEVPPPRPGVPGLVRVSLPLETAPAPG
ncbi:MAG TPA: ATP-binding protein [Verrucomicrobiae bacterium]|jgi:signal transduction histidine kinase/DNA-binding NarL/FixJ family response regulator